jgi:hypothetical protein
MSTMVTELVVPLRGSKLRGAFRREVRATPMHQLATNSFNEQLVFAHSLYLLLKAWMHV